MLFVVDQNYMRKPGLRDLLNEDSGLQVVVPDCAFEEMCKHQEWEHTIRHSMKFISSALDRTFFAAGVGELLRYELRNRVPIGRQQLLPPDLTVPIRALIESLLEQGSKADIDRQKVLSARNDLARERPCGDQIKARMIASVGRLKAVNGDDLTREIRSNRVGDDARLGLIKLRAEAICLEHLWFQDEVAEGRLSDFLTTRLVYASLWYQEFWLNGGLDDVKAKTLENDEFDMEYALIASFVDGLLSDDLRANACAAALRRLADPHLDSILVGALESHGIATGRITGR